MAVILMLYLLGSQTRPLAQPSAESLETRLSVSGVSLGMFGNAVIERLGTPKGKGFPSFNKVIWVYDESLLNVTFGSHVPQGPVVSIQGTRLQLDGRTVAVEAQSLKSIVAQLAELGQPLIDGLHGPEVCIYSDGEVELRIHLKDRTLSYFELRRLGVKKESGERRGDRE